MITFINLNKDNIVYLEVEYKSQFKENVSFRVIYGGALSDFYFDNETVWHDC